MYKRQLELVQGKNDIALPDWFDLINEEVMVWVNPFRHRGQAWGEVPGNNLHVDCSKAGVYNVLIMGDRKDHCAKECWNGVEVPPVPETEAEPTSGTGGENAD